MKEHSLRRDNLGEAGWALATTGAARMGETPDVPTMVESGLAGFVAVSFTGIAAPAKTPPAIVKKLNAAANQALNSPDVKATLTRLAVEEHLGSAEDLSEISNLDFAVPKTINAVRKFLSCEFVLLLLSQVLNLLKVLFI